MNEEEAKEIEKFAKVDNTEKGELCLLLLRAIEDYEDYYIYDGTYNIIVGELRKQLEDYKENFTIRKKVLEYDYEYLEPK